MFPPIEGKLQKIKINEKSTSFENSNGTKVKKLPLFSILWHLGNKISTLDHLVISLVGNRYKKIGKVKKKSLTDGLSLFVLEAL